MKCLRCGHCCIEYFVVIVDDPALGVVEENLIIKNSGEKCKHLMGDTPGEYSCAIHEESWYNRTPCYQHGQVESSIEDPCRLGAYLLENYKNA